MGRTTCHEWIIDSKWSRARARIVSFLWQTGVIEVPTAPTHHLHSRFYIPFSTIPHLQHRRTPTRCVALRLKRYGICRWRFVDYVSIENIKFGSLPAFSSVCFKQLPSATFFKRSRFRPTQSTAQSTPTLESNRAIISFLSEIVKTRNQPNQCEVISVI